MSVVHWRKEFGVGIEIVDHDHQQLIGRIGEHQQKLEEVYAEAGLELATPSRGERRATKRSRAAITRARNEMRLDS